jgi:hypothetical protein
VNRQLPFLATLDLLDLSRILNDHIRHSLQWHVIPANLPSNILKFDGKVGEDPNNHVMTFHLWCSSNSLMDDSIHFDYFTKWAEVMLTFDNTGKTIALFLFNHVIARFGVPQAIIIDHSSHFRNFMMSELTKKLGLRHDNSTPYYPQANGQVEAINNVLITMLRRMIGIHKASWHTMFFSTLWAYLTFVKSSTGFTPFWLVYGVKSILPIECEILSLKLVVEFLPNTSTEEERLLYLMRLDKT